MYSAVSRISAVLALASLGLAACSTVQTGPQPQTSAGNVAYDTDYGPRRPASGYDSTGGVQIEGNTGIFGTTDPITVDGDGPFPDNALSLDPLLSDLGPDAYDGDIRGDAALLAGISLPGDDGTRQYFDANIGPTVYFETNSSELTEEARATLRQQTAWLQLHPDVKATVEGHTDERGTREFNIALGERRASAVRGYMTALGVDGDRIRKVSYGKERPAVPGSGDYAWSQNRRVTTVLNSADTVPGLASDTSTPAAPIYDDPLLDPSLDTLLGTDPLSSDPLSYDSLGSDPLGSDPMSYDPLGSDPLGNDPLSTDPLSGDIPESPVLRRLNSDS